MAAFELRGDITLRALLAEHPEWADLPIAVADTDRGGGQCTWPLVYALIPQEGEEGFGDPAYNCLVFSSG